MDEDIIDQGSFYVPHFIYAESVGFSKSQKAILFVLFALEDRYLTKKKRSKPKYWFNVSNKDLCKKAGICEPTLRNNRKMLINQGWIDFKPGYTGRNSDYRLLVDKFYLANKYA